MDEPRSAAGLRMTFCKMSYVYTRALYKRKWREERGEEIEPKKTKKKKAGCVPYEQNLALHEAPPAKKKIKRRELGTTARARVSVPPRMYLQNDNKCKSTICRRDTPTAPAVRYWYHTIYRITLHYITLHQRSNGSRSVHPAPTTARLTCSCIMDVNRPVCSGVHSFA